MMPMAEMRGSIPGLMGAIAVGAAAATVCLRASAAWPPEVQTATFASPADGTEQKSLLYAPPGDEPVPLPVAFHAWSGNYRQDESPYARWCIARDWAFVHPDLRGPANHAAAAAASGR